MQDGMHTAAKVATLHGPSTEKMTVTQLKTSVSGYSSGEEVAE